MRRYGDWRRLPGVQAAAVNTDMPMRDDSELFLYVADRPKPTQDKMSWAMFYTVSPGIQRCDGIATGQGPVCFAAGQ